MGYISTAVDELSEFNAQLKHGRNIIDSLMADYGEVPELKTAFPKSKMCEINENVVKAQTALELVITDIKMMKEKKNG